MKKESPHQVALSEIIEKLKDELLPILSLPKKYLNEAEAGRYLGRLSVHTLRQWRSKGTGPDYLRVGSRIIYDMKDLDIWMGQHHVRGKG